MTARIPVGPRAAPKPHAWIDKWLAAVHDLAELERSNPMTDAVIEEIDGRMIRVGDRWLSDFASCNYLGFDLDREIIESIPGYLQKWGTHPSWSRLLGSPVLYTEIEERLTELLGAEDTLVLPTITLIHMSVIPVLAGSGTIYVESRAHKTIYEGCQLAGARGATVKRFQFEDADDLERLLKEGGPMPRLICVDGVNSMTGNALDLPAFARLAREYDALLYVDDAHGFGVLGERSDDELSPYGTRGNSIVKHVGETYDHLVLVSGLSKAYSSLAAFLTCPPELKRLLKTAAPPYLYSGPSPIAALATVLTGLDVNEQRGEVVRAALWRKTSAVLDYLARLGVHTPNRSGFPIIEVPLARDEDIDAVGRFLFDNGIYVTLAAYPLVPRNEVGFRIQVTAANTEAEIEQLLEVLGRLVNRFDLQPARTSERAA
ncbi:MAG: pyridoxal phosphate-dependent aminotransferase family protein [Actinobacteria bacterium]|nr:MAG: pyridoxal phosphate-dependent aminotransferase family protein [Actinomycetota bacterium]